MTLILAKNFVKLRNPEWRIARVYALYGLTEEEIEVVEGNS